MSKKDVAKKAAKEAATKDTRAKVEKTNLIVVEEVGKAVPDVQEVLMRTLLPPGECCFCPSSGGVRIYSTSPYRDDIHAADVMQIVHYFLMQPELPHLNASKITLRYNDHAVLENYHVAQSFLVMKNADFNVLGQLALDDFKRDMIIRATDMAKQKLVHFLQFNRVRKFVY
ncbi:unnamed protein product [Peronospora belbahrii]|uniref:PDEase domain-containing protein n=1 Tax=Peronospora belbahrii TaxID=622444 RepID=A0AAU9KWY2_9STRA|nr:unnamed protein product [Peronospora belbahrii]